MTPAKPRGLSAAMQGGKSQRPAGHLHPAATWPPAQQRASLGNGVGKGAFCGQLQAGDRGQEMLCAGSRGSFCSDPAPGPQGACPHQPHAKHHFTPVLPTVLGRRMDGISPSHDAGGTVQHRHWLRPPAFSDLVLPPKTWMQPSTHLCSSFRETVTLRLCPSTKRAARMSAHCTISPRGPPFSTRGLKTSPDSSVRKPIWIKICRNKQRGQHWGKGQFGFPSPE